MATDGGYIEMISANFEAVATVCVAARGHDSPLGFLKTAIVPAGCVIQISAGNPND